ncbi:MAG: glycosyltransferase family 4 protein [Gammaproteobacteria bacterium]|nr:glycosyltransferase family 4 protein [Gammaproteobacteria bacterium]
MQSNALTIAQLDSEVGFSGGEVQVFLLMEGLRDAGHRVILFCQPGSRCETEANRRGFAVEPVRMRNYFDLAAVWQLRRRFRDHTVDLVHANTGRDSWLGGWAAHSQGLPAVTTRRMDRRVKSGLRTRLIYEKLFQRVGAISPGVADCLRAGGVPEARIELIPEAADPARTTPRNDRNAVRDALEVATNEVLFLGMGALLRRKGFDVLLEATASLDPETRQTMQLRVGGDGPDKRELEEQATRLGIAGRVRFLGRREDTGDLLAASDVFVIPSRREGLGVAALEAMGAGRPVIASRVGGLAFSVVDHETGLLVDAEDVSGLAAALESLISDPGLRQRLGTGAKVRADALFTPRRMVDAYLKLYRQLVN